MTEKFILPTTIAVVEEGQAAPKDLPADVVVVAAGESVEEACSKKEEPVEPETPKVVAKEPAKTAGAKKD